MAEQSAFELIKDIRQQAIDLAAQDIIYAAQSAGTKNIAYTVNSINFYCDAKDVKEVSVCENLTAVPQTKPWLRGLVNSKGVLYSVTDLSLLAGFGRPIQPKRGHLLLLSDLDSQSALLVNRVIGFRYFDQGHKINDLEAKQDDMEGLSSYVSEGYHADGQDWFKLDVERLLASEQFKEVQ